MSINSSLFKARSIVFTPIDYDEDPPVISKWSHDSRYMRMLSTEPAIPLSPEQVKKNLEAIEKEMDERSAYYFSIHTTSGGNGNEGPLIGFARIYGIEWSHDTGVLEVGIGDPQQWGKGYGTQVLGLMLNFSYGELNLYHLTAQIPEYNYRALALFENAGFAEEVRRRKAIQRDYRRWDMLYLGLLREEWLARHRLQNQHDYAYEEGKHNGR
jgi:RimJ/RimL family protein N-acetyltransferase